MAKYKSNDWLFHFLLTNDEYLLKRWETQQLCAAIIGTPIPNLFLVVPWDTDFTISVKMCSVSKTHGHIYWTYKEYFKVALLYPFSIDSVHIAFHLWQETTIHVECSEETDFPTVSNMNLVIRNTDTKLYLRNTITAEFDFWRSTVISCCVLYSPHGSGARTCGEQW